MATAHEFFIVESEYGVVTAQKVRMEDDLHTIVVVVKELNPPDLAENRIVMVIRHVVRYDGREGVALECVDTALE